MQEIELINPYPNGSKGKTPKEDGLEFLKKYHEIEQLRKEGKPIYLKVLTGDYKGSIAKFITNEQINVRFYCKSNYQSNIRYEVKGNGYLIWDGRKNKIKAILYGWGWDPKYSWLKDYDGETIYKIFDKKKEEENTLKQISVEDIDGNLLNVGDKVLYVNIRYGSGSDLCRGTIQKFEAKAWSEDGYRKKGSKIIVFIKEDKTDKISKIEKPTRLILKNNK